MHIAAHEALPTDNHRPLKLLYVQAQANKP